MRTISLHGKTFESNIDQIERLSKDLEKPWREEDKAAVEQWNSALKSIRALHKKDLKYLNENVRENQVLEDLEYYLRDVGLWSSIPPHPTIEQEIKRRKDFEAEGIKIEEEQKKRDAEIDQIRSDAIDRNDYRNNFHPQFWAKHQAQADARKAISAKAFIEDFGTEKSVGGVMLYGDPPLWLEKAWQTIYDYYMNCGGDYPWPFADFTTVMQSVVSSVNGSNAGLMAQNTRGQRTPTHWDREKHYGKYRVVSAGRTLRYGGQCDEVIVPETKLKKTLLARRNTIKHFRQGRIKEIVVWPNDENVNPPENKFFQTVGQGAFSNEETVTIGKPKLTDLTKLENNPNKELIEKIVGYSKERQHGPLHIERWKRVLEALDPTYDYPYPPMTLREAKVYSDRGWKRWDPVVEALEKIK